MALFEINLRSGALQLATRMLAIVPDGVNYPDAESAERYPILYLLHGLSDDCTTWLRRTRIEYFAEKLKLVIVMPEVHRSFYTNTVTSQKYFDYAARELPAFCEAKLPVLTGRNSTFVAGLSMGGYGALKLALSLPEKYGWAACLSGAIDIAGIMDNPNMKGSEFSYIFGENPRGGTNDIFALAENLKKSGAALPKLFLTCGTEDRLIGHSRNFNGKFGEDYGIHYYEAPGVHDWAYWDEHIQKVLKWLPISEKTP